MLGSCHDASQKFEKAYTVPQAYNIVIDGEIGEWKRQGLRIPLVAQKFGETDPDSFSAMVSLAWDQEYLYLMADVKDDTIFQSDAGPIWRNDGLEIFLSTKKGTRQMVQYLLAPVLGNAFSEARIEKQLYATQESFFNDPDLKIASRTHEVGYSVELAIPFSSLSLQPAEGDTLAFNFYIGDSDSDTRHGKYGWHYNDNTYINHDAMYEVVLGKKGLNQNLVTRAWLLDTAEYHIEIYSLLPQTQQITLLNDTTELAAGQFEPFGDFYRAKFRFPRSAIATRTEPLYINGAQKTITTIDWLDILNQYVNIPAPNNFENEILLFEKADSKDFPPKGVVLFTGSSSIRLWKSIGDDFPKLSYINRGFGGSQTTDVLHFFDRIVAPYDPSAIVLFIGTNDLASGRSAQETTNNIEEFINRVNGTFNEKPQLFILSHTITPRRFQLRKNYEAANILLQKMLRKYPNATYVDMTTPALRPNGTPRPEIYTSDSLHLNQVGYEMWGEIIKDYLLPYMQK